MGEGKRGIAPCGHPGEAVVGHYYQCLHGCDITGGEIDLFLDEEITEEFPRCPKCTSLDVEEFAPDPAIYAFNPTLPIVSMHCCKCGACW